MFDCSFEPLISPEFLGLLYVVCNKKDGFVNGLGSIFGSTATTLIIWTDIERFREALLCL